MSSPSRFSADGPIHPAAIPSKRGPPHTELLPPRHENKRHRAAAPSLPGSCSMSKALGKRPVTKPARSAFEPNKGAKKLIVSKLRTVSRPEDVEQYYEKRRKELTVALVAIFNNQQPRQPLETLYRGVEDICRHGAANELFDILRAQCESYLNGPLQQAITADGGSSNIHVLKAVCKYWAIWNSQSASNIKHLPIDFR